MKRIAALTLIVALALLAWKALGGVEPEGLAPDTTLSKAEAEQDGTEETIDPLPPADMESARRIEPPLAKEEIGPVEGPLSLGDATLTLQFFDAANGEPLTGIVAGVTHLPDHMFLMRIKRDSEESQYRAGDLYPVDAAGQLTLTVPESRDLYVDMLDIASSPNSTFDRMKKKAVKIAPIAEGNEHVERIFLERRATVPMHIRFEDGQSKSVIAGVALHEAARRGRKGRGAPKMKPKPWKPAGPPLAISNGQGLLTMDVVPKTMAIWEVHDSRYGPEIIIGSQMAQDSAEPLVVSLHPPGQLSGKILGEVPGGYSSLEVGVHVDPFTNGGPNLKGAEWAVTIISARAFVEANGSFQFDNFPANGRLNIWILKDGDVVHTHSIIAPPGKDSYYEWTWGDHHSLRGVLFGRDRKPVSEESTVWLNQYRGVKNHSTFRLGQEPWKSVTTNEEGFFEFLHLPPGNYMVGPKPLKGVTPSYAVAVTLPRRNHIYVKPPTMAFVAGTVYHGTSPMPGVTVESSQRISTVTDQDGRFQLECYPDDSVAVAVDDPVIDGVPYVGVQGLVSQPGDQHIVLQLTRPAKWVAFALDAKTREPLDVRWELNRLSDPIQIQTTSPWRSRWEIPSAVPGPVRMWASTKSGRVACTSTLTPKPGEDLGLIQLELTQGGGVALTTHQRIVADFFQGGQPVRASIINGPNRVIWFPPGQYEVKPRSGTLLPRSFTVRVEEVVKLSWTP